MRKDVIGRLGKKSKKGQEEMVGFVIIIVIVAVVLLVLLGFMLRNNKSQAIESYEVENFISASLQYTSDCGNQVEFLSVEDLIVSCEEEEMCLDERDSCEVLDETLKGMIEKAWNVSKESAVKGYKFRVTLDGEEKFSLEKGNETSNYRGAFQDIPRGSDTYKVSLNVYY